MRFLTYLLNLRRRNTIANEIDDELAFHVDEATQANVARGLPEAEARRLALRDLGGLAQTREATRQVRVTWFDDVWGDLLFTVRAARRAPLLSSVAIIALSLGIGLNAGVFSLLNTMFLDAPTRKNPETFVQVYPRYEGWFTGAGQFASFTTDDYDAIRTQTRALEDVAALQSYEAVLGHEPRLVTTLFTTCNYFHVFGIERPLQGRLLAPSDCAPGTAEQVAVLSEPLWRTKFGADPQMIGQTIDLNGVPFEIIGIAPSDEANLLPGGVFVPYTVQPLLDRTHHNLSNADSPWLTVTGRLRPGYSRASAQAELTTIVRQQDLAYAEHLSPFNRRTTVVLTNGSFIQNPRLHNVVPALMGLILGPLLLVLALACTNVTMLFLSRAIVRRSEIAVRLALGIGRARLARMLVAESLLLASVAGVISIGLAYRVPVLIMNVVDPDQSGLLPVIHPDWRVFGYLMALVTATTLASSLAPMRAAWTLDVMTALKGQEGAVTMRSRATSGLIIAQIAMSFVLLAAAVLFGRFPGMVTGIDPGFDTRHTLEAPLDVDTSADRRVATLQLYRTVETRVRAIPGVQTVAFASLQPFAMTLPREIRVPQQEKGQGTPATVNDVSKDFISTFGIRLVAGRLFSQADVVAASTTNSVGIISEAFARQFWPHENPLEKIVITPEDKRYAIIGVVADVRSERFGILDGPRLYTLRDPGSVNGQMYVRFAGDATASERAVRDAVHAVDPTQMASPQTIWEALESEAEQMRTLARIILIMASIGVGLAVTGVYAVLSFAINRRTREFGIRMALGASRGAIFRSIMLRGSRQIAAGLVCGFALAEPAALVVGRLLQYSPYPLRSVDTSVDGIAALLLIGISLAGMYLPAMHATQVDPLKALRTE